MGVSRSEKSTQPNYKWKTSESAKILEWTDFQRQYLATGKLDGIRHGLRFQQRQFLWVLGFINVASVMIFDFQVCLILWKSR